MRLDHVIVETEDIVASVSAMRARGYGEAWPIGPFWPNALTAGIAVPGFNVEFVEPLDRDPLPGLQTLVYEPDPDTLSVLADIGVALREFVKTESNPAFLRMRGFGREALSDAGFICRNLLPDSDRYFFCEYAPELKARLAPLPDSPDVRIEFPRSWIPSALRSALEIGPVTLVDGPARLILP